MTMSRFSVGDFVVVDDQYRGYICYVSIPWELAPKTHIKVRYYEGQDRKYESEFIDEDSEMVQKFKHTPRPYLPRCKRALARALEAARGWGGDHHRGRALKRLGEVGYIEDQAHLNALFFELREQINWARSWLNSPTKSYQKKVSWENQRRENRRLERLLEFVHVMPIGARWDISTTP
jgi:hypothetical protein